MTTRLNTERLVLREWTDRDLPAFAALTADPEVMRHFPSTLSREESDAVAERIRAHHAAHGFGFWAVEEKGGDRFIGFVGLSRPRFESHFTPCVEMPARTGARATPRKRRGPH